MLFNALVALGAIVILLGGWGVVHVVARKRMGGRDIGCRGPIPDARGNMECCKGPGNCETQGEPR